MFCVAQAHRWPADQSFLLPAGATPVAAYLNVASIVEIAVREGVDAIHPGYGFLSESPELAQACEDAGIAFVGPTVANLLAFSDKTSARKIAIQAGVPVVPGTDGPLTDSAEAYKFAQVSFSSPNCRRGVFGVTFRFVFDSARRQWFPPHVCLKKNKFPRRRTACRSSSRRPWAAVERACASCASSKTSRLLSTHVPAASLTLKTHSLARALSLSLSLLRGFSKRANDLAGKEVLTLSWPRLGRDGASLARTRTRSLRNSPRERERERGESRARAVL